MTQALSTQSQPADVALRSDRARKYAEQSKSDRTLKLYGAAWKEFKDYADEHDEPALPASPGLVADYLSDLASSGAKVSTIEVKRAAIAYWHRANRVADPTAYEEIKAVMTGIRRETGTASNQKDAMTIDLLRKLIGNLPPDDTLSTKRDRAILLLGFAGAFRRSELVALNVGDVKINGALRVTVRKSKTDQEAKGKVKVIPAIDEPSLDPIRALRDYLDTAKIQSGAIFRRCNTYGLTKARLTSQSIALIIKRACDRAGLDARQFSGHSLRAGFITSAYNANARTHDIMELTGHKSERTLDGYIRNAGKGAQAAVKAAFGQG